MEGRQELIVSSSRKALLAPFPMEPSPFMTIAEYWQMHGYGKAEAKAMEREQIARAVAEEAMYDAMEGDEYDYL